MKDFTKYSMLVKWMIVWKLEQHSYQALMEKIGEKGEIKVNFIVNFQEHSSDLRKLLPKVF